MPSTRLPDIPFDQLALEPLEGEAPPAPVTGRARFSANTRDGNDRRHHEDRREKLRYQADRRTKEDRRPARRDWGDKGPR
ncbi:hypothetical protein [Arenimonas daejeonensis]|uniref:hypothetical protein n=1 Tax=Arenimonas daejeonensis TaxID=370777 RepID=UPI0011BEEFF8|nr:hypothetical protein [Arenimonas daejeonensis]